jgi:hypothetical protein
MTGSNRTLGISPKLIAAVVTAVLTYVLGQEVLELPPLATVAGQAVLVALAVYMANPGDVQPKPDPALEARDIHEVT